MEECAVSQTSRDHPWKDATLRRMAWAQSRESWPSNSEVSTPHTPEKPESASETGPIPNKIASWLRECRTPLGASLDEQYSTPTKGPLKNGCSFEDDLSLGAEANVLQNGNATPDPSYEMQAKEKRSQFRQKGRSMNSTGSGKSSGTVSSVSELLDLYEEDPEEILYNLGFGREEPDIASKIPSRFFNSASSAKGIDIKVYLGAQMQRMELENPNYALTSRFRQTEVLATVANVFTEIYSQVSGRPLEKICQIEQQPKEPPPLHRNSSALNVAKILKRNFTRSNLMNSTERTQPSPVNTTPSDPESHSDSESKLMKSFRKKDSFLATVTEESHQGDVEVSNDTKEAKSAVVNGQLSSLNTTEKTEAVLVVTDNPVLVNGTKVSEEKDEEVIASVPSAIEEGKETVSSVSYVDKEPCSLLPNPHMAHLLDQPRDSFEMEELQSNEDETVAMTCFSRTNSEPFLRTASQQSDSSGFAEDPTTDGTVSFLKVQESLDSCDSETTVTSNTGGEATLEHPSFEKLIRDEELLIQPGMGLFSLTGVQQKEPVRVVQQVSEPCVMDQTRTEDLPVAGSELDITNQHSVIETSSSTDSGSTLESAVPALSTSLNYFANVSNTGAETMPVSEQDSAGELTPTTEADSSTKTFVLKNLEIVSSTLSSWQTASKPELESKFVPDSEPSDEKGSGPVPEPKCTQRDLSNSQRTRGALLQAQQRSSSCEDSRGRVWVRSKDLLRDTDDRVRNPLKRSSSLPTSLQSPNRVVSSMRIQLGQGSVRHCTPPCYSYRYDEERDSIAEEEEVEAQPGCRSKLLHNPTECDSVGSNPVPPYPLNVPQHLTRSASSLYSTPGDWPLRRLPEGPAWSTNSVPDLSEHAGMPHPAIPRHIQQELPHFRGSVTSPYGKSVTPPSHSCTPLNNSYPYAQTGMYSQYPQQQNSTFSYSPYTPPHGVPFPQPYTHPQSVGYHPSAAIHSPPPCSPYGSVFNLHTSPYSPQVPPPPHSYSTPCHLACSNLPYHPNMPCGHPYNTPFHPPSSLFSSPASPFPGDAQRSSPSINSTEMQLRRVLHEIRGTVQSISQNASAQRGGTPSGTHGAHQAVQPLYEELQRRRQSLNLFRTQMMDIELTLMRQQSMVYQFLSSDERHEVEQLQRLRIAVRQELQELELQMEHQFFTLDDPLHSARSSRLYQYPENMSRGNSMESLSSSSAMKATEPMNDLLREQMFLQSELGCDGGTLTSACSSRSESPTRPCRSDDFSSIPSKRGRGLYRSSLSLTPFISARSGAQNQERSATPNATSCPTEGRDQREEQTVMTQEEGDSMSDEVQRDRKGGGKDASENVHMQQLIQQIKQSVADEIRQEIVSELLAAMSPRQSSVGTREQTP